MVGRILHYSRITEQQHIILHSVHPISVYDALRLVVDQRVTQTNRCRHPVGNNMKTAVCLGVGLGDIGHHGMSAFDLATTLVRIVIMSCGADYITGVPVCKIANTAFLHHVARTCNEHGSVACTRTRGVHGRVGVVVDAYIVGLIGLQVSKSDAGGRDSGCLGEVQLRCAVFNCPQRGITIVLPRHYGTRGGDIRVGDTGNLTLIWFPPSMDFKTWPNWRFNSGCGAGSVETDYRPTRWRAYSHIE